MVFTGLISSGWSHLSPLLLGVVAADRVCRNGESFFVWFADVRQEHRLFPPDLQLVLHVHFDASGKVLQRAVLETAPGPQRFGISERSPALEDPAGAPALVLDVHVDGDPGQALVPLLWRPQGGDVLKH